MLAFLILYFAVVFFIYYQYEFWLWLNYSNLALSYNVYKVGY